jgi:chromosome segregation ATPase
MEAEKKHIGKAEIADKKLEEAKIVISASKREAAGLQSKIKAMDAALIAVQAELTQASSALSHETQLHRSCAEELAVMKLQRASESAVLEEQLQSAAAALAASESRVQMLEKEIDTLQKEATEAKSSLNALLISAEAKLVDAQAASRCESENLALRLAAAEEKKNSLQQQLEQELARQKRENDFFLDKVAKLDEQTLAAASAEAACAAACAEAQRLSTEAKERVAAVGVVFNKLLHLDEGVDSDCTCLNCLQALADPLLLQVRVGSCSLVMQQLSCASNIYALLVRPFAVRDMCLRSDLLR